MRLTKSCRNQAQPAVLIVCQSNRNKDLGVREMSSYLVTHKVGQLSIPIFIHILELKVRKLFTNNIFGRHILFLSFIYFVVSSSFFKERSFFSFFGFDGEG